MTRWHEDDLCGRILREEGDEWKVITYRAIREDEELSYDQRAVGEALWEEQHSIAKLRKMERVSVSTFNSLYQQRPKALEGNMFKRHWFGEFQMSDIQGVPVHFVIDSAYTKSTRNDPSCILAYAVKNKCLYIVNVRVCRLEFPELLREISNQVQMFGSSRSIIHVEPKANGKSIVQQMRAGTGLNIKDNNEPEGDKIVNAYSITPFIEGGRCYVLANAPWHTHYFEEMELFPNGAHDDQVDCTVMAVKRIVKNIYAAYTGGFVQ